MNSNSLPFDLQTSFYRDLADGSQKPSMPEQIEYVRMVKTVEMRGHTLASVILAGNILTFAFIRNQFNCHLTVVLSPMWSKNWTRLVAIYAWPDRNIGMISKELDHPHQNKDLIAKTVVEFMTLHQHQIDGFISR